MHPWTQWWFVSTSPCGETKLPEQPPARRTDASRTCSSHFASGANPYFALTLSLGKLSNVHIPSSAPAVPEATRSATTRSARMEGKYPRPGVRLGSLNAVPGRDGKYPREFRGDRSACRGMLVSPAWTWDSLGHGLS